MKKIKINSATWLGLASLGIGLIKTLIDNKNEEHARAAMKLELKDEILKELTSKKED